MSDPLIAIQTIKYKTYVKQTLVQALRAVFADHPDDILKNTKVTIDFPMTEAAYPSVVVRFYESQIKNAGVAHTESIPIPNLVIDKETWFDPFVDDMRSEMDYAVKAGSYYANGALTDITSEWMPYAPTYEYGLNDIGHGTHVRIERVNNEDLIVRTGIVSSMDNSIGFIAEAEIAGSNLTARIIYRNGSESETTILEESLTGIPASGIGWGEFRLDAEGVLSLRLLNHDPFKSNLDESDLQVIFTANATSGQLNALTDTNIRYWIGGTNFSFDPETSNPDESSRISLFRTFKVDAPDVRLYKYKHYLYNGDIEFAVYALSSYDRDLISDTLVQTLAMGDLEDWTKSLFDRVYQADANEIPTSINHMINLNIDQIQGLGETQQIAPWLPEDVMVYQTSYRIGIFGEFYSLTPEGKVYNLVENVEFYPYRAILGEPVPEPNWSGPDRIQGTEDDEPDPAVWE